MQLTEYDEAIACRDDEIHVLKERVSTLEAHVTSSDSVPSEVPSGGVASLVVDSVSDPGRGSGHSVKDSSSTGAGGGVVVAGSPTTSHRHSKEIHPPGGAPKHTVLVTEDPSTSTRAAISHGSDARALDATHTRSSHRGKAPPVDHFDGETPNILFEDWIPALHRAAEWNGWSEHETLIQLAGHLRGRALQEWGLLPASERETLETVTSALRSRLDPGSRVLAAQDFRHASQHEGESVADFIRRLEQLFKLAYGRDGMSEETRGTLLHGQLQEGLRYEIMKGPAVSGSHGYKELCLAARNEEKRLAELAKRREYLTPAPRPITQRLYSRVQMKDPAPGDQSTKSQFETVRLPGRQQTVEWGGNQRRCYSCSQPGHLAKDCPSRGTGSVTPGATQSQRQAGARQIQTAWSRRCGPTQAPSATLSNLLSSDSDTEEGVLQIRIDDHGGRQQYADVQIEGVPARGIVDSGAEITIMNGKLLERIAAVTRLKKSRLKPADRIPRTYDRKIFTLDGRLDLDVCFNGVTMNTPIYVKLDAADQLLLGEGVCRQLQIITYHPSVCSKRSRRDGEKARVKRSKLTSETSTSESSDSTSTLTGEGHSRGRTDKEGVTNTSRSPVTRTETQADQSQRVIDKEEQLQKTATQCKQPQETIDQDKLTRPLRGGHRRTCSWSGCQRSQESSPHSMLLTHSRSKTVQKAGSGPPSATKPPQNHRDALYLITQPDSLLSLQNVREQPAVEREVEPGISVVPEEVNVCGADVGGNDDAVVPMVRIRLVTSLKVLPNQSALAEVEADPDLRPTGPLLLQYREKLWEPGLKRL